MRDVGIYVHIPFCKQKCYYCDFKSFPKKEDLIEKYIRWLTFEIEEVGKGNRFDFENGIDDKVIVKTIYVGGGTPSYIDSKYITEIINKINENFEVDKKVETTIEVNPGTVTENKLREYVNSGINRLSIGLQSTNNDILKSIGRIHKYEDFLQTYEMARKVGFKSINVDLMIGLPNQTIEDVEDSLKKVIKLSPEHISVYSLIVEEDTKIEKMLNEKIIELPDEEMERKMYWLCKNRLEQAGFKHYEISNFAKKGFESKHNVDCWDQKEYMGFGAAAHSYTNGVRFSNIDTIEEYIQNYENDKVADNFVFHEKQTKESQMKEYMMLGLRKINGVSIQKFKNKFGLNPIFEFRKEIEELVNKELIEIDLDDIKLTSKGIDFANIVWEKFV